MQQLPSLLKKEKQTRIHENLRRQQTRLINQPLLYLLLNFSFQAYYE